MAKQPEKRVNYTTPAGEAVYPWINVPDEREINGLPQTPAYKLNIRYAANNPAWLDLKRKIDELVEKSYAKAIEEHPKKRKVIQRAYPYQMEVDDTGEETGSVLLRLKQNAYIEDKKTGEKRLLQIPKFDAAGKPIPDKLSVYGGSIVRASFSCRDYFMQSTDKAGITMDLRAVQVLHLVTSQQRGASSFGFEAEEEGFRYEESNEEEEESEAEEEDGATDPTEF